jgi:hypothetical protein
MVHRQISEIKAEKMNQSTESAGHGIDPIPMLIKSSTEMPEPELERSSHV